MPETDERHASFQAMLRALNERHLVDAPDAREIWLIRHGDAYSGLESLDDGPIDPPLSALGREQTELLAARLATVPVDQVWSSELRRARETASSLAARLGLEARTDTRLREVRTHWDEGGVGRVNEPGVYPFPEPADEVVGRVGASVWDIAGGLPEPAGRRPRAVVVGHNAAIAIFCQHVMGVSWGAVPIFLQYTSVSVLVAAGDRMVVQSLADITHLAASRSSVRAS